jgi:hypothetical protein
MQRMHEKEAYDGCVYCHVFLFFPLFFLYIFFYYNFSFPLSSPFLPVDFSSSTSHKNEAPRAISMPPPVAHTAFPLEAVVIVRDS